MKTDSLWYYLFQTAPALFFDLIGQTSLAAVGYEFRSVELKQTAFRVDGVFLPPAESSVSIALMQLMIQPPQQASESAVELLQQTPPVGLSPAALTELIETIMVYKFPQLSRQEIAIMLGISELRQTRVFQEGLEQGLEQGERSLILRQLNRRFGELPANLQQSIATLSLSQIENLAEALLDFTTLADLQTWLEQHL
uniref:DUF4351 domain-containing protein n=1 Tax=Cyanothece sp. (strain PCC 7425 / ATCC 29141) TaxID=395961 RepID=B8HN52_CYAP4